VLLVEELVAMAVQRLQQCQGIREDLVVVDLLLEPPEDLEEREMLVDTHRQKDSMDAVALMMVLERLLVEQVVVLVVQQCLNHRLLHSRGHLRTLEKLQDQEYLYSMVILGFPLLMVLLDQVHIVLMYQFLLMFQSQQILEDFLLVEVEVLKEIMEVVLALRRQLYLPEVDLDVREQVLDYPHLAWKVVLELSYLDIEINKFFYWEKKLCQQNQLSIV
jgi:hypothetical protein